MQDKDEEEGHGGKPRQFSLPEQTPVKVQMRQISREPKADPRKAQTDQRDAKRRNQKTAWTHLMMKPKTNQKTARTRLMWKKPGHPWGQQRKEHHFQRTRG